MGAHADTARSHTLGREADLLAVLTIGFGTSVAMWALGYAARLPALLLPSPLLLALMLACVAAGGLLLGRYGGAGGMSGAASGLLTGLLNLLVLGSLLTGDEPDRLVPSALWWIPGSLLVSAAIAAAGAAFGSRAHREREGAAAWSNGFVWVAVAATMLLLAAGGVVTSAQAGLAVDDWPTSFGYNMFLYPLSKMSGGIYYEHAHRLVGALVGLTTVVMALVLQGFDRRRWVRLVGWGAVGLVIVQGVLGGLRVTERDLGLAMVHGVLAQLFFCTLVALAAITAPRWRSPGPSTPRASAHTDRILGPALIGLLICQLVLGAAQRHFHALLMVHIVTGVAMVTPLALLVGIRAWGLSPREFLLRRLGLGLAGAVAVQVVLGFGAYVATSAVEAGRLPGIFDLTLATAHQWFGAVVLGVAVTLVCWTFRLVEVPSGEAS